MGMNQMDNFWKGFEVVDSAIARRRANELAEQKEARQMAWEDEERGRDRQKWQREDQLRDVTALQAKVEAGTATSEEMAQAQQTYLPGAKSMKPIGSFSTPTKREVVNRAVTGMQRPAMGAGGNDGAAALEGLASGRRVQDDMADELKKLRAQADEATKRKTDIILGAFAKIDEAQQNGQTPILTDEEGEALISPVIQTPYFDEENIPQQYQALKDVEGYLGNLAKAKIPGRVAVNDPGILQDIALAYPQIVNGSNLKNARPSAVYIDPSPDGDPMKMKIMIGITGEDAQGNIVSDGILTKNRSSDPKDEIVALSTGEWLNMAEAKRKMLDGMAAARVALGDEKAWELAQKARESRDLAKLYEAKAAEMQDSKVKERLSFIAASIRGGMVDIEKARKLADDIYPQKADNEIAKLLFKHKLDLEMQDRKDKSEEKKADRRDAQIGMQLASMERRVNSRGGGRSSSDVEFRQSKAAARKEIDLTLKDMNDTKKAAEKAFREQKEAEQFGMPPDYSEYDQLRAEYNEKRRNYNAVLQDYTNSYGEVYAPGAVRARQGMAPPQQKPNVDALLFDNPLKKTKNNGNRPPLDSFYR